jgi:hypothetical protein
VDNVDPMSSSVAVVDGFGDDFDPLRDTTPSVTAASHSPPAASRVNRIPRKKGPKVASTSTSGETAPWLQSDEADEKERKEDMRKALRDKIRAKRRLRGAGGAAGAGGGVADGAEAGGPADSSLGLMSQLQGLDIGMIQQMAARMGIPPDQLPSKRQLMRRLNGKNLEELVAKANAK